MSAALCLWQKQRHWWLGLAHFRRTGQLLLGGGGRACFLHGNPAIRQSVFKGGQPQISSRQSKVATARSELRSGFWCIRLHLGSDYRLLPRPYGAWALSRLTYVEQEWHLRPYSKHMLSGFGEDVRRLSLSSTPILKVIFKYERYCLECNDSVLLISSISVIL